MKRIRIHKKLSIAFLVVISLTVGILPVFGQGMGIKLTSKSATGSIALGVGLDTIPQGIKGIEVQLPLMTKVEIEKVSWAESIRPTDVHIAKVLEDKQTVALYVVSDMDFATLEDKELATLNLKVEGNIEGIKGQDIYIKYVDQNAKEVVTTAKVELAIESDNGGSNNGGGSTGGGNNNDTSTAGNTSISNKDKNKDKDKDKQEETIHVEFTDIANHWSSEAVIRMASKGILEGYEDGTFKPNNNITRGEITAVLSRAFDLQATSNESAFKDVEAGKWYAPYVQAMYENGITTGRSDGTFGVQESITNEDFAVMISRVLKSKGIVLEVVRPQYVPFKDQAQISSYAQDAIKELYQLGILSGSEGMINPKGLATRAQVATIIDRILE